MPISSEELQHLRELAEAATSGPWIERTTTISTFITSQARLDAGLIDVATVRYACAFDTEPSEFSIDQRANAAFIAAANPQTIIRLLDELERQEILANGYKTANEEAQELLNELRAENEQLNKEVGWLADHCREFCESYSYCGECPMFSGWLKRDHEDCGQTVVFRGEKHTANWREAARNAVKEGYDGNAQ